MEMPRRSAEQQKSPEQIKSDVTKVILARKRELMNWQTVSAAEVATVKQELKQALGIPANEKILVSASSDRGGVRTTVESATNPLRRYLRTNFHWGATSLDQFVTNLRTSTYDASGKIDNKIVDALKLPVEVRKSVEVKSVDQGEITRHQVVDKATGLVLGIVKVDERKALIVSKEVDVGALDRLSPKPLKEVMEAFGKEGRVRNAEVRRRLDSEIRGQLDLPKEFDRRPLLFTAKLNGNVVEISVEDKETEQVIADLEYSLQFNDFASSGVYKARIKKILSSGSPF